MSHASAYAPSAAGARMSTVTRTVSPGGTSCCNRVRAPSQTTARELMSNQWYPRRIGWSPPAGQVLSPVLVRGTSMFTSPPGTMDVGAFVRPYPASRSVVTRSGKPAETGAVAENHVLPSRMRSGFTV